MSLASVGIGESRDVVTGARSSLSACPHRRANDNAAESETRPSVSQGETSRRHESRIALSVSHHSGDKSATSEQDAAEVGDVLILAYVESGAHMIEVVTATSLKESAYHFVQGRAAAIEVAGALVRPGRRLYLNVVNAGAPVE